MRAAGALAIEVHAAFPVTVLPGKVELMNFETLKVNNEWAVLFADIAAPPMNLLGPELVRDLVSIIQYAEADDALRVLVFSSVDPDYFISHVDVTRIKEYREEAAKLTDEASPRYSVSPP